MYAKVGDRIHMHGRNVGDLDRFGEVIEVRGNGGAPPYRVKFADGHEGLVAPGPDCVVEPSTGVLNR